MSGNSYNGGRDPGVCNGNEIIYSGSKNQMQEEAREISTGWILRSVNKEQDQSPACRVANVVVPTPGLAAEGSGLLPSLFRLVSARGSFATPAYNYV